MKRVHVVVVVVVKHLILPHRSADRLCIEEVLLHLSSSFDPPPISLLFLCNSIISSGPEFGLSCNRERPDRAHVSKDRISGHKIKSYTLWTLKASSSRLCVCSGELQLPYTSMGINKFSNFNRYLFLLFCSAFALGFYTVSRVLVAHVQHIRLIFLCSFETLSQSKSSPELHGLISILFSKMRKRSYSFLN